MPSYPLIISLCLALLCSPLRAEEGGGEAGDPPAATPPMVQTDWRTELRARLAAAEIVELPVAGGAPILALYRPETQGMPKGGVILLHDQGAHPDWPGVMNPLRTSLPEHGWSTLAIETAELPTGADPAAFEQLNQVLTQGLDAALVYLNQQGIYNLVLIGHGQGAILAAAYLAQRPQNNISGLVLVGIHTPTEIDERFAPLKLLTRIQKPVLDIYGAQDEASVRQLASRRAQVARKAAQQAPPQNINYVGLARSFKRPSPGHIAYRQLEVPGANHNFNGLSEHLSKRVRGWLKRHAAGKEVAISRP